MLEVNGRSYSWGDVDLGIPGLNLQIQSIDYEDGWKKKRSMERGRSPAGMERATIRRRARLHSCEMTMTGCWITANGQAHHCTACCLEKLQSAMPMTGTGPGRMS